MRRPTTLEVDTVVSHELAYELDTSPPESLYTISDAKHSPTLSTHSLPANDPVSEHPKSPSPSPSISLLFSSVSPRQRLFLLLPAVLTSVIAGGIAPFMTYVIGQVFDAFAHFPISSTPQQEDKDRLLHDVGISALELIGLAVGSLALSSITSCLWIWTGERNVMSLRKRVYHSVTHKEMSWFDTQMGAETTVGSSAEHGPLGAGGLMTKFTRETDDVRMASSLASGMLVQYLTTCITCLILAFLRSWALTLVILSAVPALMIIQAFSQVVAGPLLAAERSHTAVAGTLIDRAINAISTVKAFNAIDHEHSMLANVLSRMRTADRKLNAVWGLTSGLSQFSMMAMFVQAFWFGAKLVRQGKIASGDVVAVFWACLIATSNLQMCVPQLIVIAKGKFAAASLLSLVDTSFPAIPATPSASTSFPRLSRQSATLRKIVPSRCYGELSLHDVTFSYPSRPTVPVLKDVSLYLPANETTFIVGDSGSGKSTIAQLLLRMYTPQSGSIQLDDQDLNFLAEAWTQEHLAAVSQGCILFDMSVHDNIAMGLAGSNIGRQPSDVTRQEVIEACTSALMHEFIRDLPEGYDTPLGTGGSNLSGGQRQRLALARAKLRNPSVLILDEATSALDPTSRLLVFEAIKCWRANKTTIVITHDLSQICPNDFVYVLKDGRVAEQGYRYDLESSAGEFHRMMSVQSATGGFPVKELDSLAGAEQFESILGALTSLESKARPFSLVQDSFVLPANRPVTFGNWMFDAVADLAAKDVSPSEPAADHARFSAVTEMTEYSSRSRRPSSIQILAALPPPLSAETAQSRRYSLQFTPTSPVFPHHQLDYPREFFQDKALQDSGERASSRRRANLPRARWDDSKIAAPALTVEMSSNPSQSTQGSSQSLSFWQLLKTLYPTVPHKPLICLGLILCIMSGAMTPVFSFLLARLIFEVSIGAHHISLINTFGGLVLGAAAFDGFLMGMKYFLMESTAMLWVTRIRKASYRSVLLQDRKWFDKSENSPVRLVQILVKDGDDARNLISVVLGQALVVIAMLSVGLIWAMVRGWQLTLVGFAIGPVFAATMAVQSRLVAQCELKNKRAREEVAKNYYEAISNIRGIRTMTLESIFHRKFDVSADKALSTGVQGAFVEGCTYGVASGLIYLAEALLFYVGAVLIARGTYTYLQMVEVLNLVVFSVTIGSQLMSFTEKIAKSTQAARDFNELLSLPTDTTESRGTLKPSLEGSIVFNHVDFSYPERADVPVLRDLNLEIFNGECVAIVGASGSGKSTIAALLQRLYEPAKGVISVGFSDLPSTQVHHLRDHVSVVSQNPHLFDASISDNITYGDRTVTDAAVRHAAKAANAHEFIMELPQGYDTHLGENASLISGGQAQRIQIARALVRPSKILILDECTSALDSSSQAAVLDAICQAKVGRTVIMVTHKLPVMRLCDRIIVVDQGQVVEHGCYDELLDRKGVFASLTSGGEWE